MILSKAFSTTWCKMSNPEQATVAVSRLVGLPYQSSLLVAGGTLILYLGRPVHGEWLAEWHVWLDCPWRLESDGVVVAGSRDDERLILPRLAQFKSEGVTSAAADERTGDLRLLFSNGLGLRTFSASMLDEQWELRREDGYRFSFGPDMRCSERVVVPEG
jgi:hypothetical protein